MSEVKAGHSQWPHTVCLSQETGCFNNRHQKWNTRQQHRPFTVFKLKQLMFLQTHILTEKNPPDKYFVNQPAEDCQYIRSIYI